MPHPAHLESLHLPRVPILPPRPQRRVVRVYLRRVVPVRVEPVARGPALRELVDVGRGPVVVVRVAALVGDDGVVGAVRDEEGDLAGGVAVVAAVGVGVEGAGGDAEGGDAGAGVAGAGEAIGLAGVS